MRPALVCLAAVACLASCSAPKESVRRVNIEQDDFAARDAAARPGSGDSSRAVPVEEVEISRGTGGAVKFRAVGKGVASKYEPAIEAEKRAEEDALSKVVAKTGVNVYYGVSNVMEEYGKTKYDFIGRYVNTWATGVVEHERVGEPVYRAVQNGMECRLAVKGTVHAQGDPDPNLAVKADLDRPAYYEGDELKLKVTVTKDSYITVLHVDEDGNASLIYPNPYSGSQVLKAGAALELPGEMPFSLKTSLPKDRPETGELIHVVATKEQPLFIPSEAKKTAVAAFETYDLGGVKEISKKLARLKRADWTMRVLFFTVQKKGITEKP